MNIIALLERKTQVETKGCYVACTPDVRSQRKLLAITTQYGIPNPISGDDLHCTVIYSRKFDKRLREYVEHEMPFSSFRVDVAGVDVYGNALVLKLRSPELRSMHNSMMRQFKLSYDFPQYKPHISLSYDITGFDLSELKEAVLSDTHLIMNNIYYNNLEDN